MSKQSQTDPSKQFSIRWLPWVAAAVMFIVYLVTLNRWVTLANILPVSRISGFQWQPELFNPLQFLVTAPFRVISPAYVPLALNIFSAICAALTLGLLAKTVALLPHDRTEAQRVRERSDFAFLTTGSAWFPPLLAVIMLGFQFGFWEHATSFSGESLNLLLFAIIIWLLAEYRLDEREGRLYLAAAIYGADLADNWALFGFLPVFLTAIIWLKRLEFFNLNFLSRMALCGLAGMSIFFLLPLLHKLSGDTTLSFWEMLKVPLKMDWNVIKAIGNGEIRQALLMMSVTTLLPVLLMSIRWSANFGDSSRIGTLLASQFFHLIHLVIFGACVWIMLDPPFSPSQLAFGMPGLTLYYMASIAIGYYCGYFLLVFGKKAVPTRRNPRPDRALPGQLDSLSPFIHWGTYGMAILFTATLIYKNFPVIQKFNDDTLAKHARFTEKNVSADCGILLSDAEAITSSQQTRTLLMQSALAKAGRSKDFLVVDTQSLNWASYHRYLHKRSPKLWPKTVDEKDVGRVKPLAILNTLNVLSKSNNVCYLNPSFGYYFELFYPEPHGLAYQLKPLPENNLLPPPLSPAVLENNLKFWNTVIEEEFGRLEKSLAPYAPESNMNFFNWIILRLHGKADSNPNSLFVANLYSRALNCWGVQLQRTGQNAAAANCFSNALKINPENIVAIYNLEFNQSLQAGITNALNPARANADQFGKYRNWNAVLNANGQFDEPSFVFANGIVFAQAGCSRQAIAEFSRVKKYSPDNLPARLWLAKLYLLNQLPIPAFEALEEPLNNPKRFGLTESNSTELNILAAATHFKKDEVQKGISLIEKEINHHPDNTNLLTTAAQAYLMRGLYTNALKVISLRLNQAPNDPQWLFGKGFAYLQISNFNQAIASFTKVLALSTNDPTARFNRAFAYLQSEQLDNARRDYTFLQGSYSNSFQVAYGLGEIAWRQQNNKEAIRNYEIFLINAPTNAPELNLVRDRIKQLQKN